jgi:hypothetical protein
MANKQGLELKLIPVGSENVLTPIIQKAAVGRINILKATSHFGLPPSEERMFIFSQLP